MQKEQADGILPRSQAIACVGTIPAVSLIERLSEHGICVPEDIAVRAVFLSGYVPEQRYSGNTFHS